MKYFCGIAVAAAQGCGVAQAATVTSLELGSSWQRTDMRHGGVAEIVDL